MGDTQRRVFWLLAAVGLRSGTGSAGGHRLHGPRVLFFGDSLIAGTGALPRQPVEVRTVTDRMGWVPYVDAFGGTGYATGGKHGRPYLDRLSHDHFLSRTYDLVVLEGGTNDAHFGRLSQLRLQALRTLDLVRAKEPQARVVMVGAFAPAGVDLTRYAKADAILAVVAHDRGLQYVSQLHFSSVTDKGFLSRDRYHPSDAGYEQMGLAFAAAIKAWVPTS